MVVIKPAATILLTRDHGGELEVLLVKRSKKLAFAAGAWVFPGGKIEESDMIASTSQLSAAKLAAIRETKEETNVDIGSDQLIFYRHWTTPINNPRRYATWFFFGSLEESNPTIKIDDSEIKDYQWISPQKALDQLLEGQLNMLPPTFISLKLIRSCQSVAAARSKLQEETPIFINPIVQIQQTSIVIMYDGDAGYKSGEASLPGARHRLVMGMGNQGIHFEYKDCPEYPPIFGTDDFLVKK